jgi:hypothetical protein
MKHDLRTSDDDHRGHIIGRCRVCKQDRVSNGECPGPVAASDTANDNNPLGAPLTLEEEIGHAVMHLAMHEKQIGRMLMVRYPNGAVKPMGELLLRLGQYVMDKERSKPRLVLPTGLIR